MIEAVMVSAFPNDKSIRRHILEDDDFDFFDDSEKVEPDSADESAENKFELSLQIEPAPSLSQGAQELLTRLEAMSTPDLKGAYYRVQDAQQWYALPTAAADLKSWLAKSFLSVDEAVALSFGKAPEKVKLAQLAVGEVRQLPFPRAYRERHDQLSRYVKARRFPDGLTLSQFWSWMKQERLTFHESLEIYAPSRKDINVNKSNDDLHHHTIDVFYKVLLYVAIKDFKYKIALSERIDGEEDQNSHVASEMERLFHQSRMGISKKTFKKHLDDAARHATNRGWFKKA